MEAALAEAQERWKVFLEKIDVKFHEIMQQSESILPSVVAFQDFDTTPFAVAWQGIEIQMKQLIQKINETWQEKVSVVFENVRQAVVEDEDADVRSFDKVFYKIYYDEQQKGIELARNLEQALKRYEVRTHSAAARALQEKAKEVLGGTFSCTQCYAPLPVRGNFFRSYYQSCTYCQTVNTFEPGAIARSVEHFAVHPLAEEQALEEYFAYQLIEDQFRSQRDDEPPVVLLDEVLTSYRIYLEKYLKARIAIIPEYANSYEKDMEAKTEQIRRSLDASGWTALSARTIITRARIKRILMQVVRHHYPSFAGDDDECLGDLAGDTELFLEEIDQAFGMRPYEVDNLSVSELLDYLDDRRAKISIGENVDMEDRWQPYLS